MNVSHRSVLCFVCQYDKDNDDVRDEDVSD